MRAAGADTPTLPEDAAGLRVLLLEALARCDTLSTELGSITAERDALAERNERVHHLLLKLRRAQFGTKSEKLPEEQLLFTVEEIEATLAENAADAGKTSPALRDEQSMRRRAGRGRLPAHLPRIEVVLAPAATDCPCCRAPLVEIGVDTAERLDVIPAQFRVIATKRPKLACRGGAGVMPVVRRLHEILLGSARLFADETTMPVLDPGRGRTKKGYAWAIARDDRPWGGADPPAVVFRYAPGRGAEHAKALLAGYRGIVQCDGYAAYKTLVAADAGITLAFCWSHVRRDFIELAKGKSAPIATETLQRIAARYAIEAELRGKSPELRRAGRQAKSRPLVGDLFAWFAAQLARLPGGSPTAQAIRYALHHRDGLVRFLDDGRIELDNNTVERAIRPICLSRKNALFASGDDGGARWAAVASLVETCKLNAVDPQRYLAEVLTRLVNGWPNTRIDELMPWCWAAAETA